VDERITQSAEQDAVQSSEALNENVALSPTTEYSSTTAEEVRVMELSTSFFSLQLVKRTRSKRRVDVRACLQTVNGELSQ
jgi:hypothetical protein